MKNAYKILDSSYKCNFRGT